MPGQTVQTQMIRVYTVCHSVCIVWTPYSIVEPHSPNFRVITTNVWVSEYLGNFTVYMEYSSLEKLHPFKNKSTLCSFKIAVSKHSVAVY